MAILIYLVDCLDHPLKIKEKEVFLQFKDKIQMTEILGSIQLK